MQNIDFGQVISLRKVEKINIYAIFLQRKGSKMRKKDFMDIHDIIGKDDGELRLKYMSLSLILTNFQEIRPKVEQDFPPHVHTCFELILPIKERYCCTLSNRELVIEHGHFILIQPGQSHTDHLSSKEPFLCIHFGISLSNSQKNKLQLFVPGLLPDKQIAPIPSKDFVRDVFELVEKYKEENIPLCIFDHFFLALFQLFLSAYPLEYLLLNTTQENIRNYTYQRIFNYFNDCLAGKDFSIEEFCKVLNCSMRTLTRICNEYFYQPPHKAFQTYRLQTTLRYLQENPRATVKETAEMFGFVNEFYFSKVFKKTFGIPPSKVKCDLK